MTISAHGLSVAPPQGWEARIVRRPPGLAFLHAASFALRPDAGQFGALVTAAMPADGAFVALVEYAVDAHVQPGVGLFAASWRPALRVGDFHPSRLQVVRPGHLGTQRFFTAAGRPFCLYAVIAPVRRRPAQLAGGLSAVLASVSFAAEGR